MFSSSNSYLPVLVELGSVYMTFSIYTLREHAGLPNYGCLTIAGDLTIK